LLEEGHDVTAFFYNPNIHPYLEYKNRLESLEKYEKTIGINVIYNIEYDLKKYLRGALDAKDRCEFCYICRLSEAARTAVQLGFDAFATSLLISPYQKHEMLAKAGEETGKEYGIEFYYEDFRKGYRESREIARNMGLYMQKYCGCIFSEKERYLRLGKNQ